MSAAWAAIGGLFLLAGTILVHVLAAETYSWCPRLATRLVQFHASRLPEPLRERMREEWGALLDDTPGHLVKLLRAVDLFRAIPGLRHGCSYPGVPYKPLFDVFSRAFDLVVVAVGLVLALPLTLITVAAIKVESRGPVFTRTTLLGQHRREFGLYGFRIFSRERERGTSFTRTGYLLSRLGLEALAQLLNILLGHMSFVGPTPIHQLWASKTSALPPVPPAVFSVRPGLTGRARVSYVRMQVDSDGLLNAWWEQQMAMNVEYVMRRVFRENLSIMWTTVRIVLFSPSESCRPKIED